jgi:hypothetical protein
LSATATRTERRVVGRWSVRALSLLYLLWTPLGVAGVFAPGATVAFQIVCGAVAVVSLAFAVRTARVAVVSEPDRVVVRNTLSTAVVPRAEIDRIEVGTWRGIKGGSFPVGVVYRTDGTRITCLALNEPGATKMTEALGAEQDAWRRSHA